jgi:hypothetical protein
MSNLSKSNLSKNNLSMSNLDMDTGDLNMHAVQPRDRLFEVGAAR